MDVSATKHVKLPDVGDHIRVIAGGPDWGWESSGVVQSVDPENNSFDITWDEGRLMTVAGDTETVRMDELVSPDYQLWKKVR